MHLKLLGTGAADYDWTRFGEPAFQFSFETAAGNLLYALDGAWMLKAAVWLIRRLRFDGIELEHLARTLWPETEAGRREKIAGTGFELAFDGMELRRD